MNVATFAFLFGAGLLLAHASGAQTAVYRCVRDGGVVYSDRPCAPGADLHEIDDSRITVYTPVPTPRSALTAATAGQPRAGRDKSSRTPGPVQQLAKCDRLDQGLRDVRNKMRSGYGVKEGERLKARQRRLDEQRRAEKCD